MGCIALVRCVLVLRCGLAGMVWCGDLIIELFHGLYCSGSMCVGVTLWFGWDGVVSGCGLKPNMFRMLIHPSSGVCDLFVELFQGLYCSGSMCVGVTL